MRGPLSAHSLQVGLVSSAHSSALFYPPSAFTGAFGDDSYDQPRRDATGESNDNGYCGHRSQCEKRDGGQSALDRPKGSLCSNGAGVAGYAGQLVDWAEKTAQFVPDMVRKPNGQIRFSVQPRHWIVERTFAWLGNYGRLARDYEISPRSSEPWIKIATIDFRNAIRS